MTEIPAAVQFDMRCTELWSSCCYYVQHHIRKTTDAELRICVFLMRVQRKQRCHWHRPIDYPQRKILQRRRQPLTDTLRTTRKEIYVQLFFYFRLYHVFFCFNAPCLYTPLLNLRSLIMAAYILLRQTLDF
jgi:hypothetical protein